MQNHIDENLETLEEVFFFFFSETLEVVNQSRFVNQMIIHLFV